MLSDGVLISVSTKCGQWVVYAELVANVILAQTYSLSWHAMRQLMLTVSTLNLCCQNNNNFPSDVQLEIPFRKVTKRDAVLTRPCVGSTMAAKFTGTSFSTRREGPLLIHRTLRAETSKRNPSRDCEDLKR